MAAIQRTIDINAPIGRVWSLLTERDNIASWLMPNTFEAKLGGDFTMDCQPGIGSGAPVACTIRELEPPTGNRARLVYTWVIDEPYVETLLAIDLRETDGITRLELKHSGWESLGPKDAYVRDRHEGGWDQLLTGRLKPLAESERMG